MHPSHTRPAKDTFDLFNPEIVAEDFSHIKPKQWYQQNQIYHILRHHAAQKSPGKRDMFVFPDVSSDTQASSNLGVMETQNVFKQLITKEASKRAKKLCFFVEGKNSKKLEDSIKKILIDKIATNSELSNRNKANPYVVVFYARIRGDHFATYAVRLPQKEILVVNSSDNYIEHDKAAIDAINDNTPGLKQDRPVIIRPLSATDPLRQPDGSSCGVITTEVVINIDSNQSFTDQVVDLQKKVEEICKADLSEINKLREEKHKQALEERKKAQVDEVLDPDYFIEKYVIDENENAKSKKSEDSLETESTKDKKKDSSKSSSKMDAPSTKTSESKKSNSDIISSGKSFLKFNSEKALEVFTKKYKDKYKIVDSSDKSTKENHTYKVTSKSETDESQKVDFEILSANQLKANNPNKENYQAIFEFFKDLAAENNGSLKGFRIRVKPAGDTPAEQKQRFDTMQQALDALYAESPSEKPQLVLDTPEAKNKRTLTMGKKIEENIAPSFTATLK